MLGAGLFQASGQLPWVILDRVQGLARAFASGSPSRAALAAAILSHYAADLCVPLHTTVNRHGDRSGQHGVHKRWEVGLLEIIMNGEGWLPEVRPATLGPDPQAGPWAWLGDSFRLVPGVLADDLAAQGADPDGFGQAYWQAFGRAQIPHVKEQLTLAGERTARMILLAWTLAGSPAAPTGPDRNDPSN